ncbi:hypothetical protein JCM10296v2_003400 [Rhodotorula toruloides]
MAQTRSVAQQLTRAALPLVRERGFTAHTLLAASSSVPAAPQPLTEHTLNALFPSPPVKTPSDFSVKGLLIGNGGKRSYTRQELIALARGEGTAPRGRERTGPAKALVEEWLREGRDVMVRRVRESGLNGEQAMRLGVRERLRYNEDVMDRLPQALALLTAPSSTYLTDLSALLPLPNPGPHLYYVAQIAQDLAKASGSEAQGTAWYSLRLRLSTIYALSELSLLAPCPSLTPSERLTAAIDYSDRLFDQTARVGQEMDNVGLFAEWVTKSWAGIARSKFA